MSRLLQILLAGRSALDLGIRGADALHLAAATSAQSAGALVDEFIFVTYDQKLAKAAEASGVFTEVMS